MQPVFIDTDTASDDAVALIMALSSSAVDVVGIGLVAGNVPVDVGLQTALFVRDLCGASCPAFAGASGPLIRELHTGQHVHGRDGMGDIGLISGTREASKGHAVQALIELAEEHAGALDLVTLGPLTNIALALRLDPLLAGKIRRCVIMGGASDNYGNITPVSEFNFWCDPEAAEVVLASGMAIEIVGWDVSLQSAVFDRDEAARLRAIGTAKAHLAIDSQAALTQFSLEKSGLAGFDLPDPIAMAVYLDPSLVTGRRSGPVHVALSEGPTRGQMIIDDRGKLSQRAEVAVIEAVSRDGFVSMLQAALH